MGWLIYKNQNQLKWVSVQHRATLGSAPSNHIVVNGKGVRPLHGQFLLEDKQISFYDFQDRSKNMITSESPIRVGPYEFFEIQDEIIWKNYRDHLLDWFKKFLLKNVSVSEDAALLKLSQEFFSGAHLPPSVEAALRAQFQEVAMRSPIERLLQDDGVTDILIEGFDQIWVEIKGELKKTSLAFSSHESYRVYLQNILAKRQITWSPANPMVNFVLECGARAHLIGPPATTGATYFSIRKHRQSNFDLKSLRATGMFSLKALELFCEFVDKRANILISGETGSGKTTLLKSFISEIHEQQRIVVIEDTHELKSSRENSAFLLASKGEGLSLKQMLQESLRMRPDRLIVGEVRGGEAMDLLQAMNTGHAGSMGTLHANSARDALYRLQCLIQMSDHRISEEVAQELIRRNIQAVIHCSRKSGQRRVDEVQRLQGNEGRQFILESVLI